jgi:hypothetical protein
LLAYARAEDAKDTAGVITAFLVDENAQARISFEEAGSGLLTLIEIEVTNEMSFYLLSTNCV